MKIYNIFTKLQGKWSFYRILKHRTSGSSLGSVEGTATFTPIKNNLLYYKEEGEFLTPIGEKLQAQREYLYAYNREKDEIEKHFSKNGEDTGLFYLLKFQQSSSGKTQAIAYGDHVCINDHYRAVYEFTKRKEEKILEEFKLKYEATGPNKDYISETVFKKESQIKAHY